MRDGERNTRAGMDTFHRRTDVQFVARKIQTTRFTKLGQLVPLFPPSKIEKVSEEE